jgi:type II secretory pathway component PulF
MPSFAYSAMDSAGTISRGEIEAKTRAEAYRKLLEQKLRPVEIAVSGEGAITKGEPTRSDQIRRARLNPKRLLQFTEELADLLDAGLQLENALRVIETREEASPIKSVAAYVRQRLREGKSFSAALRECPESFSELYVNMVAAGEAAGALENILRRQAQYTAVIIDLQKRVTMALVYPSIVFAAGILLMSIFMLFLLPQLTSLLSKTGKELPFVTRALIAVSEFMAGYWWAMLLGIGASFLAHKLWVGTPAGRATWDRVVLRLPLVGPVLKQRFLAQFLQTLATLVSNGVVLLNALTLVRNATANTYIKGIVQEVALQVGEGASLSRCMRKSGFFPPVLLDIVSVGEQTGKLGPALQRGAERYDKEFNGQIEKMTMLIQPLTIVVVAIFVGVVAYSMITGILTTVSGLRMR